VKKVIDHQEKGVVIETAQQIFHADKVISTIPIGVLKSQAHVIFPVLSEAKLKAIALMGVHESTRVVMEFASPFWGKVEAPYLLLCSSSKPGMKEFRNNYVLHGKAILQTPNYAQESKHLSDAALIDLIMSDLRSAFPKQPIADPISYHVYRWTDDPFAKGAYPYRTINMNEQMHQALESSEGNIYFAGADFSRYGYSIHHAYFSGKQIAKLICEEVRS
jgi:monoamine oxidase